MNGLDAALPAQSPLRQAWRRQLLQSFHRGRRLFLQVASRCLAAEQRQVVRAPTARSELRFGAGYCWEKWFVNSPRGLRSRPALRSRDWSFPLDFEVGRNSMTTRRTLSVVGAQGRLPQTVRSASRPHTLRPVFETANSGLSLISPTSRIVSASEIFFQFVL